MKTCKYEEQIDNYLLNRLEDKEKEKFEEHYFNCSECFQTLQERDEILAVIKAKGKKIFQEMESPIGLKPKNFMPTILSFLSPKQWTVAAVSAALVIIVFVGVIPSLKTSTPQFFINDDLVRGESITLISPVFDISDVPSQFKWKSEGEDIDYQISIYNHKLIWKANTKDNFIILPEEVLNRLVIGEQYSWQVKAFSPQGILIAVSSRVLFRVTR